MKVEFDETEAKALLNLFEVLKDKISFRKKGTKATEIIKDVKAAYGEFARVTNLPEVIHNALFGKKITVYGKRGFVEVRDAYSLRLLGYAPDYEEAQKRYK